MNPPKGAGGRVYPHGRMGTETDPKPTAADDLDDDARWQAEEDAAVLVMPVPAEAGSGAEYMGKLRRACDDASRSTNSASMSAPRIVEPNSIDSADLAARDRPSAAEAHAADVGALLARLRAKVDVLEVTNARWRADAHAMEAKLGEMAKNCEAAILERDAANARAQRPRQHGLVSSLLTLLRGDR